MDCSILQMFVLLFVATTFARSETSTLTIQASDGDYVDCVDKIKQPAFNNPLLKNHQIQESPSTIPSSLVRTKSRWQTRQAHVSTANCPRETALEAPFQYDPEWLILKPSTRLYTNTRDTVTPGEIYGAKTTINVWEPKIEKGADEMSISQIWITSGSEETNNLNTIEVGWLVYPRMYSDKKTRLFIFWTSDGYNKTRCYNLQCGGFVQISSNIVIGGSISPISTIDGNQFEISVFVWKDGKDGNWWLSLGPDNTLVGYWPTEIFTTLADHADRVGWGGEIVNTRTFGRDTTTKMGSGRFPDEGFGKASYFRNLEIVGHNNNLLSVQEPTTHVATHVDNPYDLSEHFADDWGTYFFYGGQGFSGMQYSGAVRLLSSSFVYLFLVSFFII